ncbi:hypothetical protein XENORESO_022131 [Xenotaenia resolanae]|uniref:Uncharacterized protein n=1 Tax=Xenotaenia resolanae TaxID=208358 RepID=A0ABV0VVG5_9TELE
MLTSRSMRTGSRVKNKGNDPETHSRNITWWENKRYSRHLDLKTETSKENKEHRNASGQKSKANRRQDVCEDTIRNLLKDIKVQERQNPTILWSGVLDHD